MASKEIAFGSVLAVTTSTAETNIAQIRGVMEGPGTDTPVVDTTCFDSTSNFRTSVPGLIDPGDVTFQLAYSTTMLTHKRLAYYHATRTAKTYTMYRGSSTGTATPFTAWVKSIGRQMPMDELITCAVTLHVSGKPGYTT